MLSACFSATLSPTPIVQKIGLIAPFEGVYRELGYEALAAVRAAIGDAGPAGATIVPLALDSGGDPAQAQRALRKLLADPDVMGFVGPLLPSTSAAVADTAPAESDVPALLPFAANADGLFALDIFALDMWETSDTWARTLVATVSEAAQSRGAMRLVLADTNKSFATGWPNLDEEGWSQIAGMPVALVDGVEAVRPGDAVLWLGTPAEAATFINDLRASTADERLAVPVWLGPPGAVDAAKDRLLTRDKIYWATWQHEDYVEWAEAHDGASPLAHAVYLATRQLIEGKAQPGGWSVALWAMQGDGTSAPFAEEAGSNVE